MKTRYGNWIFASGGDKNGATNVGVPVGRVKISLFIGTAVAATIFATNKVDLKDYLIFHLMMDILQIH